MLYYIFCTVILSLFICVLSSSLINDFINADDKRTRILFCLVLTFLYKYSYGLLFCGLEYEDSYAFSFLGRLFANNIFTTSFLSEGIGIGSIEYPELMQTYGGHFITYSTFLSYPIRLFGFSLSLISAITTFLNFISLLILSVFPSIKGRYAWMIAPSLFCISPTINVFGNSFLCEPFSGMVILAFCYLFYKYTDDNLHIWAPIAAFALAIMTKRENISLVCLPILCSFYRNGGIKNNIQPFFKEISLYAIIIASYLTFIQNVFNIETIESQDINAPTFSPTYFYRLAPVYLKALVTPRYFGIIFFIFFSSIAYNICKSKTYNFGLAIATLWCIYFCIYTFHYRGYFFITEDNVDVFDSFRYLNNFYCLIPITIPLLLPKVRKQVLMSCAFILLFLSVYPTFSLRSDYNKMEQYNRFEIPNLVLESISKDYDLSKTTIICSDVLVYQNIVNDEIRMCDIINIKYLNLNDTSSKYFLICNDDEISYLQERYGIDLNLSLWSKYKQIFEFTIYSIN